MLLVYTSPKYPQMCTLLLYTIPKCMHYCCTLPKNAYTIVVHFLQMHTLFPYVYNLMYSVSRKLSRPTQLLGIPQCPPLPPPPSSPSLLFPLSLPKLRTPLLSGVHQSMRELSTNIVRAHPITHTIYTSLRVHYNAVMTQVTNSINISLTCILNQRIYNYLSLGISAKLVAWVNKASIYPDYQRIQYKGIRRQQTISM